MSAERECAQAAACETVAVELGSRRYDILIGENLIAQAGTLLRPLLAQPRALIVTDTTVTELHLPTLERALTEAGIAFEAFVLPPGEQTKDFQHLAQLCERLLQAGMDRRSLLIALGGGVIGDLAGFAAAILLRGVDFVQIPTTLLAQVDSSVGGKTAIDMPQGKNLVGAFHQPRLVLADTGSLASLPRRQRLAGYAEVVKYGLLGDIDFFHWLETHGTGVVDGEAAALRHAVAVSCQAKAGIVARDETERGERALLNLGHTFGHALETEVGFGDDLLHGEAVAIGMYQEARLAARIGLAEPGLADRIAQALKSLGLPLEIPAGLDREAIVAAMRRDKKVAAGAVKFALPVAIGEVLTGIRVDAWEAWVRNDRRN